LETIYQTAGPAGYLPVLGFTAAVVVFFTQMVISLFRWIFCSASKK
jgi:hypothetical protein